jgi:PAS domain S-box-containing protein
MAASNLLSDTTLEREVSALRQQNAELQRRLAQYTTHKGSRAIHGVDVSISDREELLVAAERIAQLGSWVWNTESNQVVWSDELYRILGYDPSKDAASVEAFFAALHPEDRHQARAVSVNVRQTGVITRAEHRVRHVDGSMRYVMTDGAPVFDAGGKLLRIVGTVLDVTEARESARQLAHSNALLEEAQSLGHMGSWSINLATSEVHWSPEFCRILGIAVNSAASLDTFAQHVHPDDRSIIVAAHQLMIDTGAVAQIDLRIVRGDDEVRYVRVVGSPHHDTDGNPQQVRGTMLDLTDLRKLQERLVEAERMEAIGRLAGGIAHDFNNLLMVVRGNLELMDAHTRPELTAIFNAIESAQSLTGGLLAFGRKSRLQRRVLDLNQLVSNTTTLLARLVGEHITVCASTDPSLPAVDVDSALIQQALINLVINARDALSQGGTIVVRTQIAMDGGKRFAEISVADDGPGIDDATLTHLFEPFFTTKNNGKGSGLGLAMVHGTVTQHGGSVYVTSKLGQGSRFTLRLPVATELPNTAIAKENPTLLTKQLRTILVVEDHPEVAALLENLLERSGYRVFSADRPSTALSVARDQPGIDVVLSDLSMPEMHGTLLALELQRQRPKLPIVFMSGNNGDAAHLPAGARLLGKPFSIAELQSAITGALSSSAE